MRSAALLVLALSGLAPAARAMPEEPVVKLSAAAPAVPAPAPDVLELGTPDQVRDLCASLELPENVHFTGEPSEIAEQRRAHATARAQILGRTYRVEVPAKGFVFGHYRNGQDEVELDGDRPLHAVDGALALDLSGIDDVAFKSTPAQLAEWSRQKKAGTLSLVVTFRPAGERCPGSIHARAFRLAGLPTSWRIVGEQGRVLAAADEEGLPQDPASALTATQAPRAVKVTRLSLDPEGADESKARVEGVQAGFDKCVANARRAGSLVISFAFQGGRLTDPQVIMDASRDELVAACLARSLAGAPLAGAKTPSGRGTLTLSLY